MTRFSGRYESPDASLLLGIAPTQFEEDHRELPHRVLRDGDRNKRGDQAQDEVAKGAGDQPRSENPHRRHLLLEKGWG